MAVTLARACSPVMTDVQCYDNDVIVCPQGTGRDCKARRESSSGGDHSKTVSDLQGNWRMKVVPVQRKMSHLVSVYTCHHSVLWYCY